MCGICGIWDLSAPEGLLAQVQEMRELVRHRGPDDGGWLGAGRRGLLLTDQARADEVPLRRGDGDALVLGLGHRRLSIIDLTEAGHQPMSDDSGRYWIVYNGEVYNHIELRRALEATGRTFRSRTDSEVVLQAFMEWGADCLSRFNGMWAFAIYDRERGTLFCARDRFGVKPFLFAGAAGRFAFGSESKQLVALPWVGSEADEDSVADFFLWSLMNHTGGTFFARVRTLPGSHYMEVTQKDLEAGRFVPVRYWEPEKRGAMERSTVVEEFRDLLSDAVRLRLRSDVPVGITLSGGLDSSSVACLAGEHRRSEGTGTALEAFNVDFGAEAYSERRFAEAAAARAGATFSLLHPAGDTLEEDWQRFIWHVEQPIDGLSYYANFQIYRLIRSRGIPVVLSGQGGDELLLGYERYRVHDTLFALRALELSRVARNLFRARRHAGMGLAKQAAYGLYFSWAPVRAARRRRFVSRILRPEFLRRHEAKTEHLVQSTAYSDRETLQSREVFRYQLPHLLHFEDRVSMAHSVETRLPFLDFRLLELVLGLPLSLLFEDGWSKHLLRRAMEGVLPREVQWRSDKMGYETPSGSLIRRNKKLFLDLLRRHRKDEVLEVGVLERALEDGRMDERLLSTAISYLSWKDAFGVG